MNADNGQRREDDDAGLTPRVARRILLAFLFTFITARTAVFLVMSRTIPDLYVHLWGTHVHHLNFGIVLLALVGAWLLLRQPTGRGLRRSAIVYGIGLALTFDEFGLWLHLGGSYWQRASFDAVVVIAAVLTLIAFAPALRRFRGKHWATAALVAVALAVFTVALVRSFQYVGHRLVPALHRIEQTGPR
jgi:hypothetical protein